MTELLLRLAEGRGEAFRGLVVTGQGKLQPSLLLFVGDEQVRGDDAMPRANAEAVLICADGSRYSHHCDASTPERDLGRQEARLIEKARTLLMPRMGARRSAALIDGVLDINGEIDVAGFMARMHGALALEAHMHVAHFDNGTHPSTGTLV